MQVYMGQDASFVSKIPQISKVLCIGEGRRDPSSALPGFLGPGRAENGFLNPYSIEKVS